MRYRRKPTRPPRSVEENQNTRELQDARARIANLQKATVDLEMANVRLEEPLHSAGVLIDILKRDIGKLAVELRHERNKCNFLQGFDGIGHGPWDIRRLFG